MAKILYAIQGEGMGHTTRSKAIIDELCLDHEIIVAGGDRVFSYFSRHKEKIKRLEDIETLKICYRNNKVSTIGTFWINIIKAHRHVTSFFKIIRIIKEEKPDLIISDFEHISCYSGMLKGIPVISVDNEHVISKYKIGFKKEDYLDYVKSRIVIKLIMPYASRYLVTCFFHPMSKSAKAEIFAPVMRKDILELKTSTKNYVLVYQTSKTSRRLLESLPKVDEKFIVYGFGKDCVEGNMQFKSFNENDFFKDLAGCKCVIMNGGLSLMTESIYLQKPILSVPVRKQFEQMLNAYYLEKMGLGMNAEDYSEEVIRKFLENVKAGKYKTIKNGNGNKEIVKRINSIIKNIKKRSLSPF